MGYFAAIEGEGIVVQTVMEVRVLTCSPRPVSPVALYLKI